MAMLHLEGGKGLKTCDGLTRRDFLRVGALGAGAVGLSLADLHASSPNPNRDVNCILLFLVGGPSQLDTWDPKPAAPSDVRGPFRPIPTAVPGMQICEHFPLMAARARQYAIVRSVHHEEAPIHETGQQMMQTGHLFLGGQEHPHYGAVLSHQRGPRVDGVPPFVVLPAPIGNTGVSVSHGQGAGSLGAAHEPFILRAEPEQLTDGPGILGAVDCAHRAFDAGPSRHRAFGSIFSSTAKKAFDLRAEKDELRWRYGRNRFGQSCLLARRLVEHGVRLATVNMFDTVFDAMTWDCHADGGSLATTLDDYRDTLCPMFDQAYTALLDDLTERGLLETTLVVAMGEFGRTPRLNPRGGRDHWPGVWSILFAGGGVRGGQVVGSSDRLGAEPHDRPVTPADVAATIYQAIGIDRERMIYDRQNRPLPVLPEGQPIPGVL
jgi:uncharacterized protein (DUF1501 family)